MSTSQTSVLIKIKDLSAVKAIFGSEIDTNTLYKEEYVSKDPDVLPTSPESDGKFYGYWARIATSPKNPPEMDNFLRSFTFFKHLGAAIWSQDGENYHGYWLYPESGRSFIIMGYKVLEICKHCKDLPILEVSNK